MPEGRARGSLRGAEGQLEGLKSDGTQEQRSCGSRKAARATSALAVSHWSHEALESKSSSNASGTGLSQAADVQLGADTNAGRECPGLLSRDAYTFTERQPCKAATSSGAAFFNVKLLET